VKRQNYNKLQQLKWGGARMYDALRLEIIIVLPAFTLCLWLSLVYGGARRDTTLEVHYVYNLTWAE
jgi:hypothetical protein